MQRQIILVLLLLAEHAASSDLTEEGLTAVGLTVDHLPRIQKAASEIRCSVCAEVTKDCFQKVAFKVLFTLAHFQCS